MERLRTSLTKIPKQPMKNVMLIADFNVPKIQWGAGEGSLSAGTTDRDHELFSLVKEFFSPDPIRTRRAKKKRYERTELRI